ncbi:1033_t:CDS:1 [Entrophospora sp. SA101]|nr:6989_t:CDS:1 [Entrophospora sp. SA101]CAJ0759085.1 1033_t:CDS:1 [Entrophospora sp. SA101]CAJ0843675.1 7999_t:CDS:1 [Entrophospora sp. SA101]CAJ0856847.1 15824_t:CDS:1 [Entrophospora sp. SA101]CAJ0899330.1 14349_t:CDS:1 [Entrophospora sp. SA101]
MVLHFPAPTTLPEDYVFQSCSDSFFSHLPTIVENNNWLEFAYPIPLTQHQKLYIRSSYKVITKNALSKANPNHRKYSIISGTPGIGKSMFLFYIFWQLVKEGKCVLFVTREPDIYFDGNSTFEYPQYPLPSDHQFWTFDLWCLVDSKDPTNIPGFPVDACSVILSITPLSDFISGFSKLVPAPPIFYMPLWTREELEVVAPLYSNVANIWMNRFELLGGVPHLVLEQTEQDPTSILISACKQCELEDCIKLVSIHSKSHPKQRLFKNLFILSQVHLIKMQSLLGSCAGNPLVAALCGYIFEPHAIDLLE